MKGAPITISCDCGEAAHVPYGEVWQCHSCGRRWNTAQIPAGEYWGIMRDMRRMRFWVIGIALGLTAIFGLLALLVAETLILLLPVLLAVWLVLYMPWWRRKVRRRARSVPKWNLRPE